MPNRLDSIFTRCRRLAGGTPARRLYVALTVAVVLFGAPAPTAAQMSPEMQSCQFPGEDDLEKVRQIANCRKLYDNKSSTVEDRGSAMSMIGQMHVYRYSMYRAKGPDKDPAELPKALAAYNEALKLQPEYSWHYLYRAELYLLLGDLDRAIADYTQQIRFDPKRQEAYGERGDACRAKGNFRCSIDDYSSQIKFIPYLNTNYLKRGQVHYLNGDYAAAIADFERANRAVNGFAMLWLYMARARSGADGRAELEADAKRLRSEDWPFQLVDYFLGRRSADKILTGMGVQRITRIDPAIRCQSQFYVGTWHLLRKERQQAAAAFKEATASECPRRRFIRRGERIDPVETDAAAAELRKL